MPRPLKTSTHDDMTRLPAVAPGPGVGAPSGVVAFDTEPIPFAVREPLPSTDLEAGPAGLGVLLSLRALDAQALHDRLRAHAVPILTAPFDTPFGLTFVFADPDGYHVAIHGASQ
jgi:Glyoxalase/Bleomycin resistance protein/Dioxygenase superfamily